MWVGIWWWWDSDDLRYNIYNEQWEGSPNFGTVELANSRYDQVVQKLLYALAGSNDLAEYQQFAEKQRLFMQDTQSPYFKMNLYPIAFASTDHSLWSKEFSEILGFQNKNDYLQACQEYRFPVIKQWVQTYQPKLIICFGKTYSKEFDMAFSDNEEAFFSLEINNLTLSYKVNDNGTIIAVLPFPNTPTGLKSYDDIWAMGVFLRGLLNSK